MPSGKRFFLIQYRRHGRTRRVMLGQFGPVTAEVARRRALILLAQAHSGGSDPAAERDVLRPSLTVEQLGGRFLKEHVAVRCKPTTRSEYRRSIELFIDPFCGKQRVRSVTTADVAELHGSLSHIPYQANRTLGVLSKMMNLAEIWGLRDKLKLGLTPKRCARSRRRVRVEPRPDAAAGGHIAPGSRIRDRAPPWSRPGGDVVQRLWLRAFRSRARAPARPHPLAARLIRPPWREGFRNAAAWGLGTRRSAFRGRGPEPPASLYSRTGAREVGADWRRWRGRRK
jgi:Arm DNA-binding domain